MKDLLNYLLSTQSPDQTPKRGRHVWFDLNSGERVHTGILFHDPRNQHHLHRNTLRSRLERGMRDPADLFQPKISPPGRPRRLDL